jgi:hypothetical protein
VQCHDILFKETRGKSEFRACWPSFLGVLFLDPRFWAFPGRLILESSFLEQSAARRLTVACTGCGSRVAGLSVLKVFRGESLCGRVLGLEDILFLRGRLGLATGELTVLLIFKEAGASRVAKWPKRK